MAANSTPTVAVIIPTYNRAHMVSVAIDSLLAQTRRPAQIIVVDDGSTDDTHAVLARYEGKINPIYQDNRGRSAARNAGLQQVTADYVTFLDSDDTLPPDSVALRAQVLDKFLEVDIVYGNAWVATEHRRTAVLFHQREQPAGELFPALALNNLAPIHCFMFRRACLGQTDLFDVGLETLEDHDFWLRLCTHAQFAYLDSPVATYTVHPAMTTLIMQDKMREGRLIVLKRAAVMPEFASLTTEQQAAVFVSMASTCLALGEINQAREWLEKANQTSPALKTRLLYALSLLGVRGVQVVLSLRRKLRALLRPKTRLFYG